MSVTNIPASAFKSAMEMAAESVNKQPQPQPLKNASDGMKSIAPLPTPAQKPVGKVIENPQGSIERAYDPNESALPQMIHDFAEKHNLVVTDKRTGKQAVRCEVWQFLLNWKKVIPSFESEWNEAGVVTTCKLTNHKGMEISRSTTIASNTEEFLKDKPAYAVWGMSQTRALARAAKNVYGYLVMQAGYSATPSDELDFDDAPQNGSSEGTVKVTSGDEIARLAGRK